MKIKVELDMTDAMEDVDELLTKLREVATLLDKISGKQPPQKFPPYAAPIQDFPYIISSATQNNAVEHSIKPCPKCGSISILMGRRIDGDSTCCTCGYKNKTHLFYGELESGASQCIRL